MNAELNGKILLGQPEPKALLIAKLQQCNDIFLEDSQGQRIDLEITDPRGRIMFIPLL